MEILWAEPIGFVKGSGFISLYIPTQVIIQTFLNPKILIPVLSFMCAVILEELILHIGLAAGTIFSLIAQHTKHYGSA